MKKRGKRREEKNRVIGKKWALPGTEPIPGLKEREGEKKKKKKDEEKKSSSPHRIKPGPQTLMDIGR